MEHLQVAAEALDVDVQREDRFEARHQHHERHERAQGDGDDGGGGDRGAGPADEHQRQQDHPGGASLADGGPHGLIFLLMSHGFLTKKRTRGTKTAHARPTGSRPAAETTTFLIGILKGRIMMIQFAV